MPSNRDNLKVSPQKRTIKSGLIKYIVFFSIIN